MSKNSFFILDGHALCYRAFYAVKELNNAKGQPTNAILGFMNMLRKLLRIYSPSYIVVCFDSKGVTRRKKKFPDYKIQRASMPDELRSQMLIIKELVGAFNIKMLEESSFEADDIIAKVIDTFSEEDLNMVIVSEDKDLYQLLGEKVKMYSIRQEKLLDYKGVTKKLGFEAKRIVDFLSLAGDKSDNVPGVVGVGEVTARNLINEFGCLDEIYDNIENIKNKKVAEKLLRDKDNAFLSRDLVNLDLEVSFNHSVEDFRMKSPNAEKLFILFKDLGFKRLSEEFSEGQKVERKVQVQTVSSESGMAMEEFFQKQSFVFYIDDKNGFISFEEGLVYKFLLKDLFLWKSLLEDAKFQKIVFNLKMVRKVLLEWDIEIINVFDCTLASYLLNPSITVSKASDLFWTYLNDTIEENPNCLTDAFKGLKEFLQRSLEEKGLINLYNDLEMPLAFVISKMEHEGVSLDVEFLKNMSLQCAKDIDVLTEDLYKEADEEFNINSPKQLSVILFEKLGLPVVKKTKTGFSTDEGVLTTLSLGHEFPKKILEYRHLMKLKSTYIDALPQLVNIQTKRIHAEFLQTGTETGRLSSRNPNLQNIPIKTKLGRQVRKAIIPSRKERSILSADYSQVELRVLAHLSGDDYLIKAFNSNQDVHIFTASLIYDVSVEDVTDDMRYSAKRINFGIVYGMSAFGLSKDLNIGPSEAQKFIDKYFLRYPKIKDFMNEQIDFCEKHGYVVTLLNRRRYITDIHSKNKNMRQFAQRQAINTPVQGSAADIIKIAMIRMQKAMEKKDLESRMIMSVHDELVFDVPEEEIDIMTALVREVMESAMDLLVPISISVKIGKNWLEMEKL